MKAFVAAVFLLSIVASSCLADDDANWQGLGEYKTKYAIVSEGPEGNPIVEARDTVTVHATGIVKQTNKKFWSTKARRDSAEEFSRMNALLAQPWAGFSLSLSAVHFHDRTKANSPSRTRRASAA